VTLIICFLRKHYSVLPGGNKCDH